MQLLYRPAHHRRVHGPAVEFDFGPLSRVVHGKREAAAGIVGLLSAAVLDGRDNDRITAPLKQDDSSGQ